MKDFKNKQLSFVHVLSVTRNEKLKRENFIFAVSSNMATVYTR